MERGVRMSYNPNVPDFDNIAYDDLQKMRENFNILGNFMENFPNNAGAHNSIYRGKFLGNEVTAAQYTAIANGTFEDMYIGDYWTIDNINWRIACFDYYYNAGDTACTTHHVTLVPDTALYTHVMNDTNTTDGGYVGSKMYTSGLNQAKTIINTAFNGHILNHRKYLCNAVSNGKASGGAWFDSTVELMNEVMVYGSVAWGEATYNSGYNVGSSNGQLPLFALRHDLIHNRQSWWLRDVASGVYFARVSNNGLADYGSASNANGVRPVFSIIG